MRRLLFRLDPERAHHATVEACRILGHLPGIARGIGKRFQVRASELQIEIAGLRFDNPIGLAAGWDKSGRALRILDHLGFGFLEIGSISARPSKGNPKPRLFRLPEDRAIVVNYGLPNDGVELVARRLERFRPHVPLGVNLVKTNDGPTAPNCSADAVYEDYRQSVGHIHRLASYLTLNLSCPNADGRGSFFADLDHVSRLLECLRPLPIECPVFLKVAPNPEPRAIEDLIAITEPFDFVRGFIFNLPSGKPNQLVTPREVWERMPGAVSGKPTEALMNTCIGEFYRRIPTGRFAIIGGGGVFSAEDAYTKIKLGASLVQIYTALVYQGPGIIRRINLGLRDLLARDGLATLQDAVGVEPMR